MYLKQSTAYTFRHGPFLDETDGKTAETGLTIEDSHVRISKAGGNFVDKNETSNSAHDEAGFYVVVLDATDTATVGELLVAVHVSGALPVFKTFQVVEEAIYDAFFAGSADLITKIDAIDTVVDAILVDTGTTIPATIATVDTVVDAILVDTGTTIPATLTTIDDFLDTEIAAILADTNELQTDLVNGGRLDLLIDSIISKVDVVDGIVDDILVDTAVIGAAGAGLTDLGGMSTGMKAEVNVECDGSIVTYGLDHLVSASVAGSDVTDNSIVAKLVSKESTADWDDFANTTESLQALRDRGDAAWTTGAGGTPPQLMQSTTIASLASQTSFTLTAGSADDNAYNSCVIIITDQSTGVQKAHGSISDYTGSSKTVTLGSDPGIFTMATGDTVDIMSPLGAAGSGPSAASIADAVWDEATSGHASSGTFGEQVKTDIDAILADTNELQSDDIPGSLSTISGKIDTVDGIVDNILVDTGTTLDGKIDAIDDFVDTEVAAIKTAVDAILIDTAVIGAAGAGLTAIPWNAAWDAEVQSEVTDSIVAHNLDHLMLTAVASNADMTTEIPDGTVLSNLMTKTGDTSDYAYATDSLESLGEGSVTAVDIADAVWDEATSGHVSAGTFGKLAADVLADTNEIQADDLTATLTTMTGKIDAIDTVVDAILVDTAVIGAAGAGLTAVPWNSAWDAEVQSECADALTAYDAPTNTEMVAAFTEIKGSGWGSSTDTLEKIAEGAGIWTTAIAESYAADGAAATPAQLLYQIYCAVGEFSITGTTITGKKLDGSTTAMTWTLDSDTAPTSRTRAS